MSIRDLIEAQRAEIDDLETKIVPVPFGGELVDISVTQIRDDEWLDLVATHPPRSNVEADAFIGFNQKSLAGDYPSGKIRINGETIDDEQWEEIWGLMNLIGKNSVTTALYEINVFKKVQRFKALGKARVGRSSGLPANRASRRAASKGGSPRKSPATSTTKKAD